MHTSRDGYFVEWRKLAFPWRIQTKSISENHNGQIIFLNAKLIRPSQANRGKLNQFSYELDVGF